MKSEEIRKTYRDAMICFGYDKQLLMVMEECGELLNALAKYDRGRATKEEVLDELADVSIMVEQFAEHFDWEFFIGRRISKVIRLHNRIEAYREKAVQ